MFDIKQFEDDAHQNGIRYWIAHEFMRKLGYENWITFKSVINKAMACCSQLDIDASEVFIAYEFEGVKSYKLTRFACFLVAMQADAKKPEVAKAQLLLASIAEALIAEKLETSGLERIDERKKLTFSEKILNGVAKTAGISTGEYGIFKDAGFRGMYDMSLQELVTYKGAPKGKTLYDFMGLTELAANTFRVTQTAERMKNDGIYGLAHATKTAKEVGKEVRAVMLRSSGVAPEDLEIEGHINDVKKNIRTANKEMKKLDTKKKEKVKKTSE